MQFPRAQGIPFDYPTGQVGDVLSNQIGQRASKSPGKEIGYISERNKQQELKPKQMKL